MRKRKDYWNELLRYEKIAEIAMVILGFVGTFVLFCDILQSTGAMQFSVDYEIAVDILLTLLWGVYAVRIWRKERGWAITFVVFAVLKAAHVVLNLIV